MSAKLGEILVRENLISPQHLRQALDYQREHGGRLGYNLVKLGFVSDDTITAILSRQYGPGRCTSARSFRHSRRALREGAAHSFSYRRLTLRCHAPTFENARCP